MPEACGNEETCGPVCERLGCAAGETRPAKWSDLFGIDPTFTGGQDIDTFLDESRGEA